MKNETLSKPIQPNEIEWRVSRHKDKNLYIVPYITNRSVMERLDEAFGWDKWSSTFRETATGFICQLRVETNEGFVIKEDGASKTQIEPDKGGISDSMKRCAVQFGIGRCLYDYPTVIVETDTKYIPDWVKSRLNDMVKAINSGEFNRDAVKFKNNQ